MDEREERVERLLGEAERAALDGWVFCHALGVRRMAAAYNGIGPERLPEAVRAKVTAYLALFEPAALIHDCRFAVSDGSREAFLLANDEFRRNCLALVRRAYPVWTFKYWRTRAVAHALFDIVSSDSLGWRAWLDARNAAISGRNHKEGEGHED